MLSVRCGAVRGFKPEKNIIIFAFFQSLWGAEDQLEVLRAEGSKPFRGLLSAAGLPSHDHSHHSHQQQHQLELHCVLPSSTLGAMSPLAWLLWPFLCSISSPQGCLEVPKTGCLISQPAPIQRTRPEKAEANTECKGTFSHGPEKPCLWRVLYPEPQL